MSLFGIAGTCSGRIVARTAVIVSALVLSLFAQSALSQTGTPPLNFGNNYFVTGDYVVGGVGLRGLGGNTGIAGVAQGTITIPDANFPSPGVPAGADIVAAFLYWETVESSQTAMAGQNGKFGVGSNLYAISGAVLGNPNAPVSWSSGGCNGSSQGSKTMRAYRADVRPFLPADANGNVLAGNTANPTTYTVQLADSGSNGGGAPLTLGASLVIIYRVISPDVKLNSVIIYDGAFAPANGSSSMTQDMRGFYEAAASANLKSKLTHIVGNGQSNKYETVSLNSVNLPSPYGSLPPFYGFYNGSWDNTTWSFPDSSGNNPVKPEDATANTTVVPNPTNSGCVSWGAVIFSTTVQDTDNDGLLDKWEDGGGYYDAQDNTTFVSLPGACSGGPNQPASCAGKASTKDVFLQLDYICSNVISGACDPSGTSYLPSSAAINAMTGMFTTHGITVHLDIKNAIQEQTCGDSTDASGNPLLCLYPGQPGVVGWKGGLEFLKNQPTNTNSDGSLWTESQCESNPSVCIRRFQHGRKDSYHYALFGHALGAPSWTLQDGTLTSIVVASNGVATFTTSTPHGLIVDPHAGNGRVNVSDAITSANLNGTFLVTSFNNNTSPYTFTIQTANVPAGSYTPSTDPHLSVASGKAGSGSGASDVGGADSLIALGQWGPDGFLANTQSGTFMHEFGHSLGLTHGGFWYDPQNQTGTNSYIRTFEPNCKANFQSVMNYLFQVDLLGLSPVPDYSGQELIPLNENTLSGVSGLTTTDTPGQATTYSTTKWYAPTPPNGVGTPATRYCDGRLLPATNPPAMFRVDGATTPVSWSDNQDINFDGITNPSLRGYSDWGHLDLRQIGATGSSGVANGINGAGFGINGAGFGINGAGFGINGAGFGINGAGFGINGGGFGINGGGFGINGAGFGANQGEITLEAASSVVRPPKNLAASLSSSPKGIQLNWTPPGFGAGQITGYNIYVGLNTTPAPPFKYSTASTSFTDTNVSCFPNFYYYYFVTALAPGQNPGNPQRESIPSNTVKQSACRPPYNFTGYYSPMSAAGPSSYSGAYNVGKSVTAKWTLQDASTLASVGDLNANTLLAVGPIPTSGACPLPSTVPAVFGFTGTIYPYRVVTLYSPTTGAKGNSTFRISSSNNQFIFNWDTTPFTAGCYVLELDLDSGQVESTALKLQ